MDLFLALTAAAATILFLLLVSNHLPWITTLVYRTKNGKSAPQASGSWPIIGHLPLLATSPLPHKLLGSMAEKFGPIFTINLGSYRTLIVSNSEIAKECFTTNDRVFASRPKAMAIELMGFNYAMFGFAPYGPYWREVRKLVMVELMSEHRLQTMAHVRASEVKLSIREMYEEIGRNSGKMDMKKWFWSMNLNMMLMMICGKRFSNGESEGEAFKEAVRSFTKLMGTFVVSDAVPWLRFLDLGGYRKVMMATGKKMDGIMNKWLEEVKTKDVNGEQEMFFMGALLCRINGQVTEDLRRFDADTIVKATCSGLLLAATDTTTVTLTWALALLLNHPLVLRKAQEEVNKNVGKKKLPGELDLNNLPYIRAIINETMRLYPAAPLGAPHESIDDCIVGGYNISKGTRLLINTWQIHHDPQIWTDPYEFRPERFMTSQKQIDAKGQHFELIPFGSGRRICVGTSFSLQAMPLVLASLIHCFNMKNPSSEPIDMSESPGLTNLKATPLEIIASPRLSPCMYD